ncbi:MAG: kynureninase [Granulosicoccus sp.]
MSQLPCKARFDLPAGVIYLDGNSLGPLPESVAACVKRSIEQQWGTQLIRGWNDAGWMLQPERVGDLIARLIGAPKGSVVAGDTLSIKVYQALAAALSLRPQRHVILSDSGNFPGDLYMAEGLIQTLGQGHELRLVEPDELLESIDEDVAAVLLTEVDYRTGRMHDMLTVTKEAHSCGAVMVWDLAHSAGAVPVDLQAADCEFAVGCTYKYLNGGPGAPAFIYCRPDLTDEIEPALAGWLGHESPFAFEQAYRAGSSIRRMRVGTPAVLQMSALEAALSLWDDIDMNEVRAVSIELSEFFIKEVERRCPMLLLASPRDPLCRGSQVSFRFEHGYAVMQAMIGRGVIGDFRAPDIMRFGFTPLYIDRQDVLSAVDTLQEIMDSGAWQQEQYQQRQLVT